MNQSLSLLDAQKADLRKRMMARRNAWPAEKRTDSSRRVTEKSLHLPIPSNNAIALYWPMQSELDTRDLCHALHKRGYIIGLPVVAAKNHPLIFKAWHPSYEMVKSVLHTFVPPEDAPLVEPDWLFIPMLAFSRECYRLGYGGGFYDRTLAELRSRKFIHTVGLAFSVQEVAELPTDTFDARLDMILTEEETIKAIR